MPESHGSHALLGVLVALPVATRPPGEPAAIEEATTVVGHLVVPVVFAARLPSP